MWWIKKYTINFAVLDADDMGDGMVRFSATPILRKEKLKKVPHVGDIIYFDGDLPYYKVEDVYHSINGRQDIWAYLTKLDFNKNENNE